MEELVGTWVRIYPNDSVEKYGEIKEITPHGILFKILRIDNGNEVMRSNGYEVDKIHFISFSARLTFRTVTDREMTSIKESILDRKSEQCM